MILAITSRYSKAIALLMLSVMYTEVVMGAYAEVVTFSRPVGSGLYGAGKGDSRPVFSWKPAGLSQKSTIKSKIVAKLPEGQPLVLQSAANFGGPTQPEMQQFTSVNASNLVDLFSGDFSYNIPLLDVGGYPVNLSYRSGITMDQEASWVGLGWNVNPGSITRNMRGLPDDFNGGNDTVHKTTVTKENQTIGVTAGADVEVFGTPITLGASVGVFHNNYKGWGLENGLNASINSGSHAAGSMSGGLSLSNNSQDGLTISPSLSVKLFSYGGEEKGGYGSLSLGSSYNSRSGLSGLQVSAGVNQYKTIDGNRYSNNSSIGGNISFAYPSFTPTINIPYTSHQYSYTVKLGSEVTGLHPSLYVSGYGSTQRITESDRTLVLPAYGYLNYQNSKKDANALLDFNREKDIPYRESPAIPHIAVPSYTYDVFSMSGEGIGGSFRAYRGDIGYIHDHYMRTNDESERFSIDVGEGSDFHGGVDLNQNRSVTSTGPWHSGNLLGETVDFRQPNGYFEAAYFRDPSEKTINSRLFYDSSLGGDDVVAPYLYQESSSSANIYGLSKLRRYKNKQYQGDIALNATNAIKPERDKRSEVISYLTAEEATYAGLSKYIENRAVNAFGIKGNCQDAVDETDSGPGTGINVAYYNNFNVQGQPVIVTTSDSLNFDWGDGSPTGVNSDFSAIFSGRIKSPVSGPVTFGFISDDGFRFYLNDTLIADYWVRGSYGNTRYAQAVNLVEGKEYNFRLEWFDAGGEAHIRMQWQYASHSLGFVEKRYLYNASLPDSFVVNNIITKEKRINSFRQSNHISEINVLNPEGKRYVYGIPVYNLYQKETTFSIDHVNGNSTTGLAAYENSSDNTPANTKGRDNYFNEEVIPAYAHTFLLTGILSPDYVDITGNGISDDDPGDAIKFSYSKTSGVANPFQWRAPYVKDSATYNDGIRTDSRDDKANYIYGKKELWFLNSIESKNMIATFFLDEDTRKDNLEIDETGLKHSSDKNRRLRKICLYNKSEFIEKDTLATPVKTVYFEYSYELCPGYGNIGKTSDSGKLTLKKVWFSYNGNEKGKKNPYVFTYHANNPAYRINAYDRWGNYKSPSTNPISSGILTNADYPYVIQDSAQAAENVAAWTLSEIRLPSGGIIKADYESDDYAYVQNRRAMQMCKLAGFGISSDKATMTSNIYGGANDPLYVFIKVPVAVTSVAEVKSRYLDSLEKLYFRLFVAMPGDKWGSGSEYVPCYADIDASEYGYSGDMIWVKIKGINNDGTTGGSISPLAKTAIQYLRLNLPSKAYPGSEDGDNLDVAEAVRMLLSLADNIKNAFTGFDKTARNKYWASYIDTSRSFVRLTCPNYKRLGGGLRVKRVTVYDNWSAMTQQKEATYGQEYTYTTTKEVNGTNIEISSGVAAYEPGMGGEENPFHLPIEYVEKVAALAPTTLGYTEEPLGESFYPSASVGYSKVRVRSIHAANTRSANGYQETCFYTAYDFPTVTDRTVIDDDTKKRFKPALANFLRINARHFLNVSQGFKIELNDMHGKMRSQASYAETDPDNYISYTENFYKVADQKAPKLELSNTVLAMGEDGRIDDQALIGKDAELLFDMREQETVVNGLNLSPNVDVIPFLPVAAIPMLLNMLQREDTRFRSSAAMKVIQRYGILDSVIAIDKGSRVSTKNMLYDSETGDVLLTRTQNEFNDPVYNFTYPAHWAYDGMGMAYKNIGVTLSGLFMKEGKIIAGLPDGSTAATYFAAGDEVLLASKITISSKACVDTYESFPDYTRVWAIDANRINGGTPDIYFVTADGLPFSGNDISLKTTRSGHRNQAAGIGAVTLLNNPLSYDNGTKKYSLVLGAESGVVSASTVHYSERWKTEDKKKQARAVTYTCPSGYTYSFEAKGCLVETAPIPADSVTLTGGNFTDADGSCGTYVYSQWDTSFIHFVRTPLNQDTVFWGYAPVYCPVTPTVNTADSTTDTGGGGGTIATKSVLTVAQAVSAADASSTGPRGIQNVPLGRTGIWPENAVTGQWSSPFVLSVTAPATGNYYLGFGVDNRMRLAIDSVTVISQTTSDINFLKLWHIIPITLTAGVHHITVSCYDDSPPAILGFEIYNNTISQIQAARSYDDLNIVFSTKSLHPFSADTTIETKPVSCPSGYTLVNENGANVCQLVVPATDSLVSYYCYSALQDTLVNPYIYGILGNYRTDSAYVYYGQRVQTMNGTLNTGNIRKEGTFNDFAPFWQFSNYKLGIRYDSTRWVWNTTPTLFNIKGFELENKDPLGRYNSGIYGYNNTLPVAVIQNGRFSESVFDGFEDYNYNTNLCDTVCSGGRHFDFSAVIANISSEQKHTGKYSLKVSANSFAGVAANVGNTDYIPPAINVTMGTDNCAGTYMQSLKTDGTATLPPYGPVAGSKVLISAWVKEMRDCKCESYTNNQIVIGLNTTDQNGSIVLTPSGSIIEGWQRYESVVDIPSNTTQVTFNFKATGSSDVYFDDLRVIPYHANMKSFVYHPVNLRLVAEMDENNYATFYEYDDDGTLIRVKKETQRGIKTIKETRSALRVNE